MCDQRGAFTGDEVAFDQRDQLAVRVQGPVGQSEAGHLHARSVPRGLRLVDPFPLGEAGTTSRVDDGDTVDPVSQAEHGHRGTEFAVAPQGAVGEELGVVRMRHHGDNTLRASGLRDR
ncbi:hypothetical protein AQJ54_08700 [Streptomyces griseorubiginosus]|uniref:Uncharacterized protein n=1 Tax=Streptomyces griseorubiginosus TaxID=67304 RepID=A0A117R3W4_9ACTN|nr:hypothetical protein AQJ54_08700 [Streptomyces griseorubiginosus]